MPSRVPAAFLLLALLLLSAMAADVPPVVTLYSQDFFQGTRQLLGAGDSVSDFQGQVPASVDVPAHDLVLQIYAQPNFTGTKTLVFLGLVVMPNSTTIGSVQVIPFEAMRSHATDVVIVSSPTTSDLPTLTVLPLGRRVSNISTVATLGQHFDVVDIPQGVALDACHTDGFAGPIFTWNASAYPERDFMYVRSFRVRRTDDPPTPPATYEPSALFFASFEHYTSPLVIPAGQEIETMVFVRDLFPINIQAMEVPPGLIVLGYVEASLYGVYTPFPAGFYTTGATGPTTTSDYRLALLESFRVLRATDALPPQPILNPNTSVVCAGKSGVKRFLPLGRVLSVMVPQLCFSFQIPRGLAVVGYDQPWLLGRYTTWNTTSDVSVDYWSLRLHSLQVVSIDQLPPPPLPPPGSPVMLYGMRHDPFPYWVGDAIPAISTADRTAQFRIVYITVPPDVNLILFDEYNFQGAYRLFTSTSPALPLYEYKSLKVVSQLTDDIRATPFVGCYTPASVVSWTPIFLGAGDAIAAVEYPWDQSIDRYTVPAGLVVVAFSERNFTGACGFWTKDAVVDGVWTTNVRSLRVLHVTKDTQHLCPTTTTPTVAPTMTASLVPTTTNVPKWTTRQPTTSVAGTNNDTDDANEVMTESPSVSTTTTTRSQLVTTIEAVTAQPIVDTLKVDALPADVASSVPLDLGSFDLANQTKTRVAAAATTTTSSTPSVATPKTPQLNDGSPEDDATEPSSPRSDNTIKAKTSTRLPPSVVVASSVGAVVALAVAIYVARRRRQATHVDTTSMSTYSGIQWRDLDLVRLDCPPLPLTHLLATGASGAIYLATFLDQTVVVKTFASAAPSRAQVQALVDEISFMSALQSSRIVALEGAAWTQPIDLQAVLEYMDVGDLRHYLATTRGTGRFTWPDKLACALSVAEALFYLHSQAMIHRDLKSRNVLLDSTKGTKLGDFGASKEVIYGDTLTANVGTFRWMAPEMLLFQPYTSAVDVFSLGVLLSELSTHHVPYVDVKGKDGCELSDEAIARRVIHDDLRPTFEHDCPDWFHDLAMACMQLDPDDRPTAIQIMFILKTHLHDDGSV
ncbi:Aste57867_9883 [Aphanomyces stellatus]|uniref:Aste57867_9883 protein n=1 Tax=Aphanomyces stellatus TaxID=120398 RepID=A0A485KNZ8_9STRA|nr:hypothetical protein As57867_009844 [Aphanomyces stellatus]VFT86762.1 Aste57867_9883 [Aphanomyces stellatus]